MSKQTSYLLGMFVVISLCSWGSWIYCCGLDAANGKTDAKGFTIMAPDQTVIYAHKDNFNFRPSQFTLSPPISIHVDQGIDSLRYYLNNPEHTNDIIKITGYYYGSEKNTSALTNLGLARANTVKNYLINKGVPSQKIETTASEYASNVSEEEELIYGPVGYTLITKDNSAQDKAARLAAIKAEIKAAPLVLQFESAQSIIDLSHIQQQKVINIKTYLNALPEAKLQITGYTDNTGSRVTNIALGLNRANFAKTYFINEGINASQIDTYSKGAENPIASNQTAEGRAKNRRCIITLN